MPDLDTVRSWQGRTLVDRDGGRIGPIEAIYLDDRTGQPEWALVNTGLFGTTQTFVPLVHATEISDGLQVPYEKRHIKDAPRVDTHDELTSAGAADVYPGPAELLGALADSLLGRSGQTA